MGDTAEPQVLKESDAETQRKLRLFVSDLVEATIGKESSLSSWVASSVHMKLCADMVSFYPDFGTVASDDVGRIGLNFNDDHDGLFYLHKHETIVLLRVAQKSFIQLLRATNNEHHDAEAERKIAEQLRQSGLPCTATATVYIPYDSNNEADIHTVAWHSDATDRQRTEHYVHAVMLATITRSSARDTQKLPGPSDLGNPCDLCVARRLASSCGIQMSQAEQHFSLKAWLGTSVHQRLESDLPSVYPYAEQEITVPVGMIHGLGLIKGHVDLYLPRKRAMDDWKTTDMKKLEKIKAQGVPYSHFGQTMLYIHGIRRLGKPCDHATLTYIPRDSSKKSDIWVASCAYREDVAVGLLNRAKSIMVKLQDGDVGSFQSDPGCFVCHVQHRIRR